MKTNIKKYNPNVNNTNEFSSTFLLTLNILMKKCQTAFRFILGYTKLKFNLKNSSVDINNSKTCGVNKIHHLKPTIHTENIINKQKFDFSFNIQHILDFHTEMYRNVYSLRKRNKNSKLKRLLGNNTTPQIYFPERGSNSVNRFGGMVVHQAIEIFIKESLPKITQELLKNPEEDDEKTENFLLECEADDCVENAYNIIATKILINKYWKENIIIYSKHAMKNFCLNFHDEYLTKKTKFGDSNNFGDFIKDFRPIYQEFQMDLVYNGARIYFKPDLIIDKDGDIVLIDFKSGNYSSKRSEKDRLQVLLFAWCLKMEGVIDVDSCEIHYLGCKKKKIKVEVTKTTLNRAGQKVNVFIHQVKNGNYRLKKFRGFEKNNNFHKINC